MNHFFRKAKIRPAAAKPGPERNMKNGGGGGGNIGNGSGSNTVSGSAAKPLSYDNYSTDTSSQFSVDIVEVATRGLDVEEGGTGNGHLSAGSKNPAASKKSLRSSKSAKSAEEGGEVKELNGSEVVLNASKLQVESETKT